MKMPETSVYELINTLCEKLREESARKYGNTVNFRTLRAQAFEIVLKSSGSSGIHENPLHELDFHLFEMHLKASTRFHRQRNDELKEILEAFETNPIFQNDVGKSILTFLLHMRNPNPPDTYTHFQDKYPFGLFSALQCASEENPYITFTDEMFYLPGKLPNLNVKGTQLSNPYFKCLDENLGKNIFTQNLLNAQEEFSKDFNDLLRPKAMPIQTNEDEQIYLPPQQFVEPPVEKQKTEISLENFLYDLRALCMGIKSPSFLYSEKRHEFRLRRGIRVENLTVNTLRQHTSQFIEFGTCMRRLQLLISPNFQSQLAYGGFTFRAFYLAISQYLQHVQQFISLGRDRSLLEFSYRISNVIDQVTTLGRICYLNPRTAEVPETFPIGGKLLQYVSSLLHSTLRPEIFLLLANILRKCAEFYFSHLEKWIYQGILEDRHRELFIVCTDQYSYDTKKFFDRAYSAQEDLIPDFLAGLHEDIVLCGKYTMLLKAYKPFHPFLDLPKPNLRVCLSSKLIFTLEDTIKSYVQRAEDVCGPKITIDEINRRKREKVENLKQLVEKTTRENLHKWEIERKEADAKLLRVKQERLAELKLQIENAREDKAAKRREEVAEELMYLEQNSLMEEIEMRRQIEEREHRIQHYRELNELAEKKLGRMSEDVSNENYRRIKKSNSDILNANEGQEDNRVDEMTSENYKNCDNSKLNVNLPGQLSECQRNKLKVMSHEFNIAVPMDKQLSRAIQEETMTELERNRRKILHRDFNSNTEDDGINGNNLRLNFETERMRNRKKVLEMEFNITMPSREKLTPMSTTSDYSEVEEKNDEMIPISTGSSEKSLTEDTTDNKDVDEDVVDVEDVIIVIPDVLPGNYVEEIEKPKTSAFLRENLGDSSDDLTHLNAVSMKEFLRLSMAIPLRYHMSLLNGEIMKMFLGDLDILGHWQSLRNFFLLIDGEFGNQICDGLFERLERGVRPAELLNFHTFHTILDAAMSLNADPNRSRLSFIASAIPGHFDLQSPDVLESLQLSYRVEWPVNLILSPNTLHQYLSIFQYLLKVRRIGWILESLFGFLKEISHTRAHLKNSLQFRHIHMMRHKFSHFVHTLQTHITVTALQASWDNFMTDLKDAQSMMDLYKKHTNYIKRIKFLCMLNRQSWQFLSSLEDIFKLIIRFSRNVRAKEWSDTSRGFVHPKYDRLRKIEQDFDKITQHIIQMGWKIVSNGYQTEIGEFISHLNWGNYYADIDVK